MTAVDLDAIKDRAAEAGSDAGPRCAWCDEAATGYAWLDTSAGYGRTPTASCGQNGHGFEWDRDPRLAPPIADLRRIAREDVPALVAEVERLTSIIEAVDGWYWSWSTPEGRLLLLPDASPELRAILNGKSSDSSSTGGEL